jgi:two-component system, NtrC family, sensor kinase
MPNNDAPDALERLISLGHLSAGVGHHVINAFSAIVSNAELLRLNRPVPTTVESAVLAQTIINTALEAATVARRLIDYTRPVTSTEPSRSAFTPDTLDLNQVVARVVESSSFALGPRVRLETDLSTVTPIKGHEHQLRSMLVCLLQNAYDSLEGKEGVIVIATAIDHRGWNVLEVRDTGKGMEADVRIRAVEPFFSTKPGHLGVGLSIANGIWRRHGGTLSIQTGPHEGTLLRLCIEPFQG